MKSLSSTDRLIPPSSCIILCQSPISPLLPFSQAFPFIHDVIYEQLLNSCKTVPYLVPMLLFVMLNIGNHKSWELHTMLK